MQCSVVLWIFCIIDGDRCHECRGLINTPLFLLQEPMNQKKKVLFLSSWFPLPADNGSKLRIYSLLRGLSNNYDVALISFVDSSNHVVCKEKLESICLDVKTVPLRQYNPKSYKSRLGFLSPTPRSYFDTYSHEMVEQIKETIAFQNPDVVIASQIGTAIYRKAFINRPALFEEVEIGLYKDAVRNSRSFHKHIRNQLTWEKHRRYLANLLSSFQACTLVSDIEKHYLRSSVKVNISSEVIPNCINSMDYQDVNEIPDVNTLIFTGSFTYFPNYEGICWFVEKAFPLIQAKFPKIKLVITGNQSGHTLPPSHNIYSTGYVDDVRPFIAKSSVCIAPILSGGGTRLKILEAMTLHTPVVTTTKGAEGLEVTDGLSILIGDSPEEFADNVIKLLNDHELRQILTNTAYDLILEKYEWSVVMPRFISLVESTINNNSGQY